MPVLLMRILSKSKTTLREKCRDFSEQLSKFLPALVLGKRVTLVLIRNFAAGTKFPARDTRLEF